MMKILLLSSKIDAENKISRTLEAKGAALLFPEDAQEALQILEIHGISVDLAIFHLEDSEGKVDSTLQLLEQIKSNSIQADLPIILSTDSWSDEECAKHQEGTTGANAYLKWPFAGKQLWELIESVLRGRPTAASFELEQSRAPEISSASLNLEDLIEPPSGPLSSTRIQNLGLSTELQPPAEPLSSTIVQRLEVDSSHGQQGALDIQEEDTQAQDEMPYLFNKPSPEALFAEPLGNAVIPGGAAQDPDLETFKKYLLLREQDVAVLSRQLKGAQE